MSTKKTYTPQEQNPLLLLTAKYFSHITGFASFDAFLKQTHYYKINLTKNVVVENYTGNGSVSLARVGEDYGKVLLEVAKNYVYEEDRSFYVSTFDVKNMAKSWKEGKDFVDAEFRFVYEGRTHWIHVLYEVYKEQESDDLFASMIVINIDMYRKMEHSANEIAKKDILTGLYNRSAVKEINEYLANESTKTAALVTLDIDNFKQINDRYGHSFGDKVIKLCADKLRQSFESTGIVCRIGGDEFVALIRDCDSSRADEILQDFIDSPMKVDAEGKEITVTISVGYALFPDHGDEYKKLYKKADMAMYSVKMNVKGQFRMFSEDLMKRKRDALGFNVEEISRGMPGGFMIYNADASNEIVFANDELIKMMGCKDFDEFHDYTGGKFTGFVHPNDLNWVMKSIENQQEKNNEKREYLRYRVIPKNGSVKTIEDYGHIVHSKYNGDLFFVFILDNDLRNDIKFVSR